MSMSGALRTSSIAWHHGARVVDCSHQCPMQHPHAPIPPWKLPKEADRVSPARCSWACCVVWPLRGDEGRLSSFRPTNMGSSRLIFLTRRQDKGSVRLRLI